MALKQFVGSFDPDTEAIRLGAIPSHLVDEIPNDWTIVVSIASSLTTTNWREYFFFDEANANAFWRLAMKNGYAVLTATPDEY